jgi:hypothetical protein
MSCISEMLAALVSFSQSSKYNEAIEQATTRCVLSCRRCAPAIVVLPQGSTSYYDYAKVNRLFLVLFRAYLLVLCVLVVCSGLGRLSGNVIHERITLWNQPKVGSCLVSPPPYRFIARFVVILDSFRFLVLVYAPARKRIVTGPSMVHRIPHTVGVLLQKARTTMVKWTRMVPKRVIPRRKFRM